MKIKIISISFLIIAFFGTIQAQETKSALFIGNSYTSRDAPGQNLFDTLNIPNMTSQIAASFSDSLYYVTKVNPGRSFEWHIDGPGRNQTISRIKSHSWDYVSMQEQSLTPVTNPFSTFFYSQEIVDSIKSNNECTEIVFYMTWGRENGWGGLSFNSMQDILKDVYLDLANDYNSTVAPVGEAVRALRDQYPAIDFYVNDGSHPTPTGKYLAACVFYAAIFQKSPLGSTYIPSIIDPTDAMNIQMVVDQVVFDSLSVWRIGHQDELVSDFSFTGTNAFQFVNNSINADSCYWEFGDGSTSSEKEPNYTFTDSLVYDVTLSIFNDCSGNTTSTTQQIDLRESMAMDTTSNMDTVPNMDTLANSIGNLFFSQISIFPNPAKNVINIESEENVQLDFYDLQGLLVKSVSVERQKNIDISDFSEGLYIISVLQNGIRKGHQKLIVTGI